MMSLFVAWWRPSPLERNFLYLKLGGGDDLLPRSLLKRRDQRNRLSSLRGSTGSTNSVDIGFDLIGDIVVDDAVNCFDVQPSSCDIGRDQGGDFFRFESIEYLEPSILVMVAME